MIPSEIVKSRRGRPANEALQGNIIKAAGMLFLQSGFQATTMDKVAKAAGISKLSIYRYFPNKEALFSAAIASKCYEFAPDELFIQTHGTPGDRLLAVGEGTLSLLMSDGARGVEAMIMGDKTNRAQLAQLYYEAGPKRILTLTEELLRQLEREGQMKVADPGASALLFCSLFKGADMLVRRQLDPEAPIDEIAIRRYCLNAVGMFLRAHRPDSAISD